MSKLYLLIIASISFLNLRAQQELKVVLNAGAHTSYLSPAIVRLTGDLRPSRSYKIFNRQTGVAVPAQLLDSSTLVFISGDTITAGGSIVYSIVSSRFSPEKSKVKVVKKPNGLQVEVGNRPLLFYHTQAAKPPVDSPAYYKRSGFIHPLYSPDGSILTDDFPKGHAHQHGIFMAWTNTTFKNASIDFWNQHQRQATVEHVKILDIQEGPVFTKIKTLLSHRSFEFGEIIREVWTLTVYPFSNYFLIDLESEQQNVTKDTLRLNQYHYGGLAFRGSKQWNRDDPESFRGRWNILTSEEIKDSAANNTRARWVDASGNINNGYSGVTVFDHPSNFRYPQPIRVHPFMPYWCYATAADGAFSLAPRAIFKSRYRYLIHEGHPHRAEISKLETSWAFSPLAGQVISK